MKAFKKLVLVLNKFMAVIAGVTLVLVMFLTVTDVVLRYFGHPITGVYDLVALGGAIVIGFSIPYAAEKKVHVFMEMIVQLFHRVARQALLVFTRLIALSVSLLVFWNLVKLGLGFRETGEASLTVQIAYYPIAIGLGVCFLLQTLVFVMEILNVFGGGGDE